jgi:LuxR family maltose regulon positive regulatory protein
MIGGYTPCRHCLVSTAARPGAGFARTKIQPPRPRSGALIERPALEARLGAALLSQKLVLVSAAAGFGKTSALARQIGRLPAGTALAWIACDEGDPAPTLFECLVAALEPWDPPWRIAPEALIATAAEARTPAALRALSAEVVNALNGCEVPHGVLMVDDLHRVRQPEVFQFIDQLLERLPPHWTFCVATRQDPPIALARLRARGEIAEFRFDDLRFDRHEARALAAGAGLDAAAADALFERSQGWPVGLRLALTALRGAGAGAGAGAGPAGATPAIDRHVFDFLATEVLDRQPPALRDFLLRCSVLDELSAARCAAVSGDAGAAQHLEHIERAGLFVSTLAEDEPTLRLHDLFRDALQQRLKRERPDEWPLTLQRAAAGEQQPLRRVGYLLQAEAWGAAAAELRRHTPMLLTSGRVHAVLRSAEQFPAELRERLPDVQLALALTGWARWAWGAMLPAAQMAIAGYQAEGRSLDVLEARAYGAVALHGVVRLHEGVAEVAALAPEARAGCEALLAAGTPTGNEPVFIAHALVLHLQLWNAYDEARLDALPELFGRELNLLERCSQPESWFRALPLPSFVGLPGMDGLLMRFVRGAMMRMPDSSSELHLSMRGVRGSALVWAGQVAAGRQDLEEAAEEVRWRDTPLRATLHVYTALTLACVLQHDRPALQRHAAVFEDLLLRAAREPALRQRIANELFTLARWQLAAGDMATARRLFEHVRGWNEAGERTVWRAQRLALPGYVALIDGDSALAERTFADALAAAAPALEIYGQASELRLRLADLQLQRARGADPGVAQAALRTAAHTLAPLFTRHHAAAAADTGVADAASLWIVGPSLLARLAGQHWGAALGPAQQAQLVQWCAMCEALGEPAEAADTLPPLAGQRAQPIPAGLTRREYDVLERIAAGDSNKLIARAFDLSPHTVKRHVANILDKLGLASRGQAAAWLRDHDAT